MVLVDTSDSPAVSSLNNAGRCSIRSSVLALAQRNGDVSASACHGQTIRARHRAS
jgi:hypothetical protein